MTEQQSQTQIDTLRPEITVQATRAGELVKAAHTPEEMVQKSQETLIINDNMDLTFSLTNFEKLSNAIVQMQKAACLLVGEGGFTRYGNYARLDGAAAELIQTALGICQSEPIFGTIKETVPSGKRNPEFDTVTITCSISFWFSNFEKSKRPAEGAVSTSDPTVRTQAATHNGLIPSARRQAETQCRIRGVGGLLGLRRITIEFLRALGLDINKIKTIEKYNAASDNRAVENAMQSAVDGDGDRHASDDAKRAMLKMITEINPDTGVPYLPKKYVQKKGKYFNLSKAGWKYLTEITGGIAYPVWTNNCLSTLSEHMSKLKADSQKAPQGESDGEHVEPMTDQDWKDLVAQAKALPSKPSEKQFNDAVYLICGTSPVDENFTLDSIPRSAALDIIERVDELAKSGK